MARSRCAAAVTAVGLALGALAGCGTSDAHLSVTPARALYDAPLHITVSGLDDGDAVTLHLTTRAADNTVWRSTQRATTKGHRVGVDGVRLLSGLKPDGGGQHTFPPPKGWTMQVSATRRGDVLARRTVTRLTPKAAHAVRTTELRPADGGLYGELYEPTHVQGAASGVVIWGGSEGGLSIIDEAAALAAHGHPTLALAYFDEPGLPKTLERIPLEYFRNAVRRLIKAPNVDRERIFVFGISRGTEAAIQTALDFPGLVHGVIAGVPASAAIAALPNVHEAAWTLHGKPVPTSPTFAEALERNVPASQFQVGQFPGGLLLSCGEGDRIWPSCPYAKALRERSPQRTTLLDYALGGHFVGSMFPGTPSTRTEGSTASGHRTISGGTAVANAEAQWDAWPKVLHFLDS